MRQSGWLRLQQTLKTHYKLGQSSVTLREGWLIGQLTTQIRELLDRIESNQPLPSEVRTTLTDLTTLASTAGASSPPLKTMPWLLRLEHLLLGDWQTVTDGQVRCPCCGSNQVGRKSTKPRLKKYYNEQRQVCEVAVYRYYCRNSACQQGSFTDLPLGLLPYSRYRTETHLLAIQMYAWGYSTYRRTGDALGIASLTAWRWVNAWGYSLLPIAALFGVLKSSGVVGIDEKYVLVPKNNKPGGKMRRWMYVYLAVDVHTCDLLHIAIYANNDHHSATAFLLALRTKGYHPQVVVTDLRLDYGPTIAQVFPKAVHHECIFHAMQNVQELFKQVYGPDYAKLHPHAVQLKRQIYRIFAADTLPLATERYAAVLALRPTYLLSQPEAAAIFDFLERHWPKLSNSIGSDVIPTTNNAVERVIGRFDQHYQSFRGFESIEHAQSYLAVFEKLYRFTPFSKDARPALRGRCPLQVAGYDISQRPLATLCSGLTVIWPLLNQETLCVPKS